LYDDIEYQNGLNPMSNDTDSDQWKDGAEYNYWHGKGIDDATAGKYMNNPDVDGDGITDYQEVYGYTVKVATSFDQNGNPIMQEKTMYGDPLLAYGQGKDSQGNPIWTDTDGDNIPDIVEVYFSNTTNIDNNATWEHIKSLYPGIGSYQWCREYYWALNGSDPSKAENWTQKAFNPFVVCNLPPMITTFTAEVHEYGEWNNKRYTIRTQFVVKDLRGVAEVKQELYELVTGKLYASHTYNPGAGYTVITAGWEFDVDYWTLTAYGYNVKGTVKGESGLSVSAEQKISGLVTMVVDAIMALGAMLLGGLQKAWEAVQSAYNTIRVWLLEKLEALLGPWASGLIRSIKTLGQFMVDISPYLDMQLNIENKEMLTNILKNLMQYLALFLIAKFYNDLYLGIVLLFSPFITTFLLFPEDFTTLTYKKIKEVAEIEIPNFQKTIHELAADYIIDSIIFGIILFIGIITLIEGISSKIEVKSIFGFLLCLVGFFALAIILLLVYFDP